MDQEIEKKEPASLAEIIVAILKEMTDDPLNPDFV